MIFSGRSQPCLYGLLYVSPHGESHANLRAWSGNPVDIYLLCSALCAMSVAALGGTYVLITNNTSFLKERCKALGINNLELLGHSFRWTVPKDITFHSAHYKLELIEAFGTGLFGECAALIDVDTVFLRPLALPPPVNDNLIVYDITNSETAAFGSQRIRHDLELVAGRPLVNPRWYGGEFLVGTVAGFAILAKKIRECWPIYLENKSRLIHNGDEMVVSAALNLIGETGTVLINADCAGGVVRWWSGRTKSPFPPFSQIEHRSLLHLPSDKAFLAKFPRSSFDGSRFVRNYREYAARKILVHRIIDEFSNRFLGRTHRYVPKLD